MILSNGVGVGRSDAPPVEALTVGRVTLPTEYELVVHVQNGGPNPVTLEQVVVNDALWDFRVEPDNRIPRLGSAEVVIPYTWVEGEAYEIVLISETGTTFDAEVPVAVLTPGFSGETFSSYALIGFYVGVVPVTLGLLWYPFLRRLGTAGMNFVLALTVGLLVFLVLDTLLEAVEIAGELPGAFSGVPMVILVALLTLLGLLGVERLFRRGREEASRLATSYRIALGIGLHNLGEGLAIGAVRARRGGPWDLLDPRLYPPQHHRGSRHSRAGLEREEAALRTLRRARAPRRRTGHRRDLGRGLRLLEPPLCRLPRRRSRGNTPGRLRGGTPPSERLSPLEDARPLRHEPRRTHRRDSDHVRNRPAGERVGCRVEVRALFGVEWPIRRPDKVECPYGLPSLAPW